MHAVTLALLLSVAQQTLEAAGSKVAIMERDASTLNFDFNESKLSAIFVTSPVLNPVRWQFDASVSLAARKGTRDIFARGTLTPEFSAAGRASLIVEQSERATMRSSSHRASIWPAQDRGGDRSLERADGAAKRDGASPGASRGL